jgi:cyclopropane fatty-acyl-phospholipid synthase-like methyltransferase
LSFFDLAYEDDHVPPWDIGRPQREIVRLAQTKQLSGSVLDVGCGTGENALYLASLGHETWGVDSSPNAIAKAKEKAQERRLAVRFLVRDALELGDLGRTFDNVIDTGLFHIFSDEERPLYVLTIASVLRFGGRYYMLCFSDHVIDLLGPRHVTRREIRATFRNGWKINYIRAVRFEDNIHADGANAWLSSITREESKPIRSGTRPTNEVQMV